jgi:hypothetical protein
MIQIIIFEKRRNNPRSSRSKTTSERIRIWRHLSNLWGRCTREQRSFYPLRPHSQEQVAVQVVYIRDTLLSPNLQMHRAIGFPREYYPPTDNKLRIEKGFFSMPAIGEALRQLDLSLTSHSSRHPITPAEQTKFPNKLCPIHLLEYTL